MHIFHAGAAGGFPAFAASLSVVLHGCAVFKDAKSVAVNDAEVHENVLLLRPDDEAETLAWIKPLDNTFKTLQTNGIVHDAPHFPNLLLGSSTKPTTTRG
jgi:hypothetical protein